MSARKVALLAVVTLLIPTVSYPSGNQSAPCPATQAKLITPFQRGHLGIGVAVTRQGNGKCFAASAASPSRLDAWRCSMENAILDPCLQNIMGDPNVLACPDAPWTANVVLLTVTSPLPSEPRKVPERKDTMPWALELANGQRCTLFTGATAPIAGMRINYGCPGGFIVVGDIDRSQPVWRVFFQGEKSISLEQTEVAVAWY
jgi:hypothetical protein